MNRTVSTKLSSPLNCCVGNGVTLNVRAIKKLTSYGTSCETSGVPALILAASINSDSTYSYVFQYDSCVLLDQCNYLVPTDIESVCCTMNCGIEETNCDPCFQNPCNYVRTCCG